MKLSMGRIPDWATLSAPKIISSFVMSFVISLSVTLEPDSAPKKSCIAPAFFMLDKDVSENFRTISRRQEAMIPKSNFFSRMPLNIASARFLLIKNSSSTKAKFFTLYLS